MVPERILILASAFLLTQPKPKSFGESIVPSPSLSPISPPFTLRFFKCLYPYYSVCE